VSTWIKSITASAAIVLMAMMLTTQQANAGCTEATAASSGFVPALYTAGSQGFLIQTHFDDWQPEITGLWKFAFTAEGNAPPGPPDGTPIDAGYVTWHADGTEIMNSGREPMTGNFCMGVWKWIGDSTYKLNHYALSWDSTGTVLVGPANIREKVTVDRSRNHYSGAFSIDQYATDGKTLLEHVVGKVTATRITVD
jgi:hypothetical protein